MAFLWVSPYLLKKIQSSAPSSLQWPCSAWGRLQESVSTLASHPLDPGPCLDFRPREPRVISVTQESHWFFPNKDSILLLENYVSYLSGWLRTWFPSSKMLTRPPTWGPLWPINTIWVDDSSLRQGLLTALNERIWVTWACPLTDCFRAQSSTDAVGFT